MAKFSVSDILKLKDDRQAVFVNAVSQYVLEKHNCYDTQSAMLGKDIYSEYQTLVKKHPTFPQIPQSSFVVMLSFISHSSSSTSAIKSAGKKQGYYVDKDLLNPDAQNSNVPTKIKEQDLYPVLTEWLNTKIDKAFDVSNKRGAKKWQNADILGVSFIQDLTEEHRFELHAMEVKVLHNNWRVDLFQAVSHSRFANRSYFAFMLKNSDIDKLENDFKEYAYQFGIGLVAIVIKDEYWQDILAKKRKLLLSGTDDNTDDSICEIREICFAPYHSVNPQIRTAFLEQALDIRSFPDLKNKFDYK